MIREMERIFETLKDDFNRKLTTDSIFNLFARTDEKCDQTSFTGSSTDSFEDISLESILRVEEESVEEIPSIQEETISMEESDGLVDNSISLVVKTSDVVINQPESVPVDDQDDTTNDTDSTDQCVSSLSLDESINQNNHAIEVIVEDYSSRSSSEQDAVMDNNGNIVEMEPSWEPVFATESQQLQQVAITPTQSPSTTRRNVQPATIKKPDPATAKKGQTEADSVFPDKNTSGADDSKDMRAKTGFRHHSPRHVQWSQMVEVVKSGVLSKLTRKEIQLQEAMFEIISSEASYYHNLMVLTSHFLNSELFSINDSRESLVSSIEKHHIFSNIILIMTTSFKFLVDVENRWNEQKPILSEICDILLKHVTGPDFQNYVTYLRNQQYQTEALKRLSENESFKVQLKKLEAAPVCEKLSLDSYLMLPLQRITRMRLLVENVIKTMSSSEEMKVKLNQTALKNAQDALDELKKLLNMSESEKGIMDQKSAIITLMGRIEFPQQLKRVTFSNKLFVREGNFKMHPETVLKTLRKITKKRQPIITLFLFNDLLIISKKKVPKCIVIDYASRNAITVAAISPNELAVPNSANPSVASPISSAVSLRVSPVTTAPADSHILTRSRTTTTLTPEDRKRHSNPPTNASTNVTSSSSMRSLPGSLSRTFTTTDSFENESRQQLAFSLQIEDGQTDIFSSPVVLIAATTQIRNEWVNILSKRSILSKESTKLQKSMSLNTKPTDPDAYHRNKKLSLSLKSTDAQHTL